MIICKAASFHPSQVSLTRQEHKLSATLPIQAPQSNVKKKEFVVCYHQALKYNFKNYYQFVEAMEVNQILGASAFVLYNHSGHGVIRPFAMHYMRRGVLDFYNWPLRDSLLNNTFNYAQNAIINDCLYRYMHQVKYLIFVDFDEVLVPHKHKKWQEMLSHIKCQRWSTVIAKNTFFRLDYSPDTRYSKNEDWKPFHLNTLSKTLRDNYTWPCSKRSKYVAIPEEVIIAGVHSAHQTVGPQCCVSEDLALLHHYRFWNKKFPTYIAWRKRMIEAGTKDIAKIAVRDRTMHRFQDKIFQRVAEVHRLVNQSAQLALEAELLVPWWR